MTIFELFPWGLAICIAFATGTHLSRAGHSGAWVWIIAAVAGVASFVAYWLALRSLVSWGERQRARKEKWEREHRRYHDLDSAKPVGGELFYECSVCGCVIPSAAKKGVACLCRNLVFHAESRHLEIRDRTKVRLFSYAAVTGSVVEK